MGNAVVFRKPSGIYYVVPVAGVDAGAGPTKLATPSSGGSLAVDGSNVYCDDGVDIYRRSLVGSATAEKIASIVVDGSTPIIYDMGVDESASTLRPASTMPVSSSSRKGDFR